jgi:ubiquinone/menaquinone biosynthesis C-methylase UbiE
VIYQHPLAYLLAMEGLALMRAWSGDFDEDFVRARLLEVQRLLEDDELVGHPGVHVRWGDVPSGYRDWAPTYDDPANGLFELDAPIVAEILDGLGEANGRPALDAACGTGRLTSLLVERGYDVVGMDRSPEMLDVARARFPNVAWREGDLHALPFADSSFDVVLTGLALAHLPALEPVLAEFARVLRPGGHLVISDTHHELILRGSIVKCIGLNGEPGFVPTYRHTVGDFLRAALTLGLDVRRCEEPGRRRATADPIREPRPTRDRFDVGEWTDWPWNLLALIPDAVRAAWDAPAVVVWHFQSR